jgi:hypothetical protein
MAGSLKGEPAFFFHARTEFESRVGQGICAYRLLVRTAPHG